MNNLAVNEEVGNLSVRVSLDSTGFQNGISGINKQLAVVQSEFKAASAELGSFGTSSDHLKLKADSLSQQIDLQKQKVQALEQAFQTSAAKKGLDATATQNLQIKLNYARAALANMETELGKVNKEIDTQMSRWNQLGTKLEQVKEKFKSVGEGFANVGSKLSMGLSAPIVAAGAASAKLASDMNESLNKVEVSFKENSQEVKAWSESTLQNFGIAKGTALDMSSLFGDMGTAMGQATGEASKMSTGLVGLAGDLASFKNIGIEQAQEALKGIYTGEGEALKTLGIIMQDSTLQSYALATGQKKAYDEMTQAEKVALRYAFVMDATKNAQGDFARTGAGAANQSRIFSESLKELGASFGEHILPVVTPLLTELNKLLQSFGRMDEGTKKTILVLGAISAALGPVLLILGNLITAISAIAGAFSTVSGAIAAAGGIMAVITGPVGITIAALAGLVAIGIAVYKNWDTIKAKAQELWNKLIQVWNGIKAAVMDAWSYIGPTIMNGLNQLSAFWNEIWPQIKQVFLEVWNAITLFLAPVVAGLYVVISGALGFIQGAWQNGWNLIKDEFKLVWDVITGILKIAWDLISGIIKVGLDLLTGNWSKAWDDMKSIFKNLWNDIKGLFRSMATDAIQWGKDLVQGLIDGIKGMIGSVINAVKTVANTISSYLHFSTPDEGPLSEYETWMPDFMSGLAQGIERNKGLVKNAISGLAMEMKVNPIVLSPTGGEDMLYDTVLKTLPYSNSKPAVINFYGNYGFNSKEDINYFMNQAARLIQRKK